MKGVPWWVWVSAAPLALGAWAPIIPGRERQRPRWVALGLLWSAIALAGWAGAVASDGDASGAGALIILAWAGATATSLSIHTTSVSETASTFAREREGAERRLERPEAQRIAAEQPDLALEPGIGRPVEPGAQHAGLVDVNNASLGALLELPGIDDALATRIVEMRAEINGFASVHDLGGMLDLDGNAIERLRDWVVFLPR